MAVDSRECGGSWDDGGGTEQGGHTKAVFVSSCFAVPKFCGLFLPLLHTKEMEINF